MDKFKEWLKDMGYESTLELVGEIIATVGIFAILFMISVIGG